MGDFGSRVLAVRDLANRIKKPHKDKVDTRWTPGLAHGLSLDQIEADPGEIPIYIARCECGWESKPSSQSLARLAWKAHDPWMPPERVVKGLKGLIEDQERVGKVWGKY